MLKKPLAICFAVSLLCASLTACSKSPKRNVSEKFIGQIDGSSWLADTFRISPDSTKMAYVTEQTQKKSLLINEINQKSYDDILTPPLFSSDSQKIAYVAQLQNKQFVVITQAEETKYDSIVGSPAFSPDSKHFAYAARKNRNKFVIIDGIKTNNYDNIITTENGDLLFDSSDSLHYLAQKDNYTFLVEEHIENQTE